MEQDFEDSEPGRRIGANLVTSWVLAALLLILSTFIAQFPGVELPADETVAVH